MPFRLLCVLALLTVRAAAEDWPEWRGPGRDAVVNETGLLETFPKGRLPLAWQAAVGPGWSSPVIAKGRVFLMDAIIERPKAKERLHCFEESTGKELWQRVWEVDYPGWAFTPGQTAGPTSTPLVRDGRIYILGETGDARCLETDSGKSIWERPLGQQLEMKELAGKASPLLEDGLLILLLGGKPDACIVAFHAATGEEAWRALSDELAYSSPIVITAAGRRQLIAWTQQSVSALDPKTGALLWREPGSVSYNDAVATPVVSGEHLLVGGMMFRLHQDAPGATLLWPAAGAQKLRNLSNTASPMIRAGHVYSALSNGELVCYEALTRRELWKVKSATPPRGGSGASIHLTAHGETTLLYNDQGELIRAALTPGGYREISRAKLLDPVYPFGAHKVAWSAPSFANGRVFARNEKTLVAASLRQ